MGAAQASEALLADRLRVLGPDHSRHANHAWQLAYWRGQTGDLARAADAYEALLADRERVLGPNHPATLTTRASLDYWRSLADDQVL